MNKLKIGAFFLLASFSVSGNTAPNDIQNLNNQIQQQLKQLQAQQNSQLATMNSQLQGQIKQLQGQLQDQIQKLNTQTQAQIQQLQNNFQQQMGQLQKEVAQIKK